MEIKISILSLLISLSALGISIWRGKSINKHNKLTLSPHIIVDSWNDGFDSILTVDIINKGNGVGFISAINCRYKNFDIFNKNLKEWNAELTKTIRGKLKDCDYIQKNIADFKSRGEIRLDTYLPWNKDAVASGEKINILKITFIGNYDPYLEDIKKIFRTILDNLSVEVKYRSLYNEISSSRLRRR